MPLDIALDFGTAKTVIAVGSKIVVNRPTVAVVDAENWEPLFAGDKAKDMLGRNPDSLEVVSPIECGSIADCEVAEYILKNYLTDAVGNRLIKPRVIIPSTTGATSVQIRRMAMAIENSGGRNVCILDTPIADALAVGIDLDSPNGSMIIDIGAGVTDIATLALGDIVECEALRVASNDFDEAIIRFVKKEHNVLIGNRTAEAIKKQVGTVYKRPIELTMQAKGRNLFSGMPQIFEISSAEVLEAVSDVATSICTATKRVLEHTSPDVISDIMEQGVYLMGGGAKINGMSDLLSEYLNTDVMLASDPELTTIRGANMALKSPKILKTGNYQFRSIQELIVE